MAESKEFSLIFISISLKLILLHKIGSTDQENDAETLCPKQCIDKFDIISSTFPFEEKHGESDLMYKRNCIKILNLRVYLIDVEICAKSRR